MTAYRLIASCVALAACGACGAEPSASRTPQVSTAVVPAARARNAPSASASAASTASTPPAATAPASGAPSAVASPAEQAAPPDPVAALLALGGVTIQSFLLVMLVGVTAGVYSSIGIAAQLLVSWEEGELARLAFWRRRREPAPSA